MFNCYIMLSTMRAQMVCPSRIVWPAITRGDACVTC